MGSSGYTPPQGETGIARTDNPGVVWAPLPGAPVHETAMGLLPQGLQALTQGAQKVGWDLRSASRNLDGGLDATRPRQLRFHAGRLPTSKEPPRHRQATKRGRTRRLHEASQALRMRVERPGAWAEKSKRRRCARMPPRHYGMQWLASTCMNLRAFCGT